MVRCGDECVLPRPFSIHQVNDDRMALFYAVWEDGKGTGWLSQRKAGDNIDLLGPLGNGFVIQLLPATCYWWPVVLASPRYTFWLKKP